MGWNDIRLEQLAHHPLPLPIWRPLCRVAGHPVLSGRRRYLTASSDSPTVCRERYGVHARRQWSCLRHRLLCLDLVPGRERHDCGAVWHKLLDFVDSCLCLVNPFRNYSMWELN